MYLGYNLLISQRTIPINASFVAGIASMASPIKASFGSVHLPLKLCFYFVLYFADSLENF